MGEFHGTVERPDYGTVPKKRGRTPKKHVAAGGSGLEERRRNQYYIFRLRTKIREREFRKLHQTCECRQPDKPIYSWALTSAPKVIVYNLYILIRLRIRNGG